MPTQGPGSFDETDRTRFGDGESGESATEKRIGPYEILEEIGRGGMGIVYKAFHPALKRTGALKVLIAGEDASEEAIARFHREAEAVAKLGHHPNIVPVYDIGRVVGAFRETPLHYFAMHYVEGPPLDRVIDEGKITPRQAATIAKKLAEALAHAHSHGVLHRDIKPANALMAFTKFEGERFDRLTAALSGVEGPPREPKGEIPNLNGKEIDGAAYVGGWDLEVGGSAREGGEPMLTDFGLAKDVESESQMTRSGMTLGTPAYMPPEQAEGRLSEIDERSDVYALGATLYEMLTLRPPFEGSAVIDVIRKVQLDDPVSPRKGNPSLHRDLETITLKCLEKLPERRYPAARDLAMDLGRFLEGSAIVARPPSLFEKTLRKVRRHKGIASTVLIATLLLAVGSVIAFVQITRGKRDAAIADAGKEQAERLLDKNKKVAQVLLGAYAKLTKVLAELKRSRYDDGKSLDEKRKVYRGCEGDVQRFCDGVSADPASQSTMLAVKGWMLVFGGYPQEALDLFGRARSTDPDVAWGYLLEAMARLAGYLEQQPLPGRMIEAGEIHFGEMPDESKAMRKNRETFEALIAQTPTDCLGVEQADRFLDAMEGFRGLRDGNHEKAERGLTKAFDQWSLAWMEEEIHLARAKVRYLRHDLDGALKDLHRFRERCPGSATAAYFLGLVLHGKALEHRLKGEDPVEIHRKSIDAYSEAIRNLPGMYWARNERGNATAGLAKAREDRGEDPRPDYRSAVEDFRESLRAGRDTPVILYNLAKTLRELAKAQARRGTDPRPLLAEAIANYDQVVRHSPDLYPVYDGRGNAYLLLGEAQAERGIDPRVAFEKAIAQFGEVLRRSPGNAQALCHRGNARFRLGQAQAARGGDAEDTFRRALEDYDKALQRKPDFTLVYANRGNVWLNLGELRASRGEDPREAYEKAIGECRQALESDPHSVEAYNCRGQVYTEIGWAEIAAGRDPRKVFRKAVEDFDRGLKRNPAHPGILNNRGQVYLRLGDWESLNRIDPRGNFKKAIDDFTATLRLNPDLPTAFINRACARLSLGMAEEAMGKDAENLYHESIQDSTEAIQRNPSGTEAYNNRGNAHRQLGDFLATRGMDPGPEYAKALEDYGEAVKRSSGSAPILFNRGRFILFLADLKRSRGGDERPLLQNAVEDFRGALRKNPEYGPVYSFLAGALRRLGEKARRDGTDAKPFFLESVANYKEALKRIPNHLNAQANLGITLEHLGRWKEAAGAYEKALALNGQLDTVRNQVCFLLTALGELDAARRHADRLAQSPRMPGEGHYALGVIETVSGNAGEALAAFERALRAGTNPPYCLFHILRSLRDKADRKKRFDAEFPKLSEEERTVMPAMGCRLLVGEGSLAEIARKSMGFDEALFAYYVGVFHQDAGESKLAKAAFEKAAGMERMVWEKVLAQAALKALGH
ncbi:MAG: protein kinase domain-containing protein [Planctomycetota bacterium]